MITVLIAEDDLLARVGIATVLKENPECFQVIGEASNGNEALLLVRQLHPDVLLTDIEMPGMNGIELIRIIKQENLCPHLVILSSYNDYSYVHEGMLLGADDYILKLDLEKDYLKERLLQICNQPISGGTMESAISPDKCHRQEYEKDRCIFGMVTGSYHNKESLLSVMKSCNLSIPEQDIICLIVQCSSPQQTGPLDTVFFMRILDMLIDYCASFGNSHGCMISIGLFCIVLSLTKQDKYPTISNIRAKIQEELLEYTNNTLNPSLIIRLSNPFANYRDIEIFFSENCRYECGAYRILENFTPLVTREYEWTQEMTALEKALENNDCEAIQSVTDRLLDTLSISQEITLKELYSLCYTLLLFMEQHFRNFPRIKQVWHRSDGMLELNQTCFCKGDYLAFIKKQCVTIQENLHIINSKNSAIYAAEQYIHCHYNEDFSLDDLAAHVGLNASYLSRSFFKTTGKNVVGYVKDLRIAKAKELLLSTDTLIKSIGEAVGYPNHYYFCRIFKKYTGFSPSQYRREHIINR